MEDPEFYHGLLPLTNSTILHIPWFDVCYSYSNITKYFIIIITNLTIKQGCFNHYTLEKPTLYPVFYHSSEPIRFTDLALPC